MGDRLGTLVDDELGGCCEEDVEERREELSRLYEDDTTVSEDVRALSALGDATRYRIVSALVGSGRGMCVCEFDVLLDVTESAVSHALSELRDAGLVEREKRGRWRYYTATDRARRLVAALDGEGGR